MSFIKAIIDTLFMYLPHYVKVRNSPNGGIGLNPWDNLFSCYASFLQEKHCKRVKFITKCKRKTKKPVKLNAMQYTGDEQNFKDLDTFTDSCIGIDSFFNDAPFIDIHNSRIYLHKGDYVAKDIQDDFIIMKKEIFEEFYITA